VSLERRETEKEEAIMNWEEWTLRGDWQNKTGGQGD